MTRSIAAGFVLTFFALVSPVSAGATEGQSALAPPGRCAEPLRAAVSGAGEGYAVVGPVLRIVRSARRGGGPARERPAATAAAACPGARRATGVV